MSSFSLYGNLQQITTKKGLHKIATMNNKKRLVFSTSYSAQIMNIIWYQIICVCITGTRGRGASSTKGAICCCSIVEAGLCALWSTVRELSLLVAMVVISPGNYCYQHTHDLGSTSGPLEYHIWQIYTIKVKSEIPPRPPQPQKTPLMPKVHIEWWNLINLIYQYHEQHFIRVDLYIFADILRKTE